ncbi:MAG: S41 family peptidase [Gemmatimonadetes bacterium]|jgi:carboxyl-terminal processing protease|nr:S41 family peptidase [Gemmatimonadota bacterium]
MIRILTAFSLSLLLLTGNRLEARSPVEEEFLSVLWTIAQRINHFYFEEIPPDTLMHAGARGIFNALDPGSDYTLTKPDTSLAQNFFTLMKVSETIAANAHYIVPPDSLIRFGVAGMMEILDPYTVFMEKRNLANFNIQTQGHYGGLGFRIQVVYPDSAIAVWSLLHEDTPAARAGVRSGDLIVAINDTTTKDLTAGDAADKMRGPPGTPVTLTLERAGAEGPIQTTIFREEVQMRSVPHYTLFPDSTGYIKLTRFQSQSSREVQDAIETLLDQGMKRLIFDLRGNGGGYLQEAVAITDLFLPRDKLVVFTAGRAFRDTTKYYTERQALLADQPLVVMVDRGSASASEIVAGAVQDWDRGLILGSPTVGKGSVQQTIPIEDKGELKLTMAAWHTPSGRSIDKRMRKDSSLVSDPSLIFKTRLLDRTVRGGGGITPDLPTTGRRASPLYNQLSGWRTLNSQFFYFARQYHVQHPGIAPSFRVDKNTLDEFRKFVDSRDFEYISEAEAPLQNLEEKVEEEEEYKKLGKHLKRLLSEIDKLEENHWDENADLLSWKLTYDILEKNFGVRTALAYDVSVDPQIQRALDLLANPQEYEECFQKSEIGLDEEAIAQEARAGEIH